MKNLIYLPILLILLSVSCKTTEKKITDHEAWTSMFNGEDLTGWTVKINGYEAGDNYKNTFRVQDGKMVVSYDGYDSFGVRFGHIFYNEMLSNYHIKFDYRFIGEQAKDGMGWAYRNSGIMLHCQSAESMGVNQDFPISIEAQLLGGDGKNERSTMNLCTPGTNVTINDELITTHCLSSTSSTYHGDQWVTAEVIVNGSIEIKHIVNGDTVFVYQNPQIGGPNVSGHDPALKKDGLALDKGFISLQSESHPVEFKNIMLKKLN